MTLPNASRVAAFRKETLFESSSATKARLPSVEENGCLWQVVETCARLNLRRVQVDQIEVADSGVIAEYPGVAASGANDDVSQRRAEVHRLDQLATGGVDQGDALIYLARHDERSGDRRRHGCRG